MKSLYLSALLLLSATSAHALESSDNVAYACQSGKNVTVRYHFNDVGLPTRAVVSLNGQSRTLNYDMTRSDNVDTFFQDASGYTLSTSYMDTSNYRNAAILINAPDGTLLYKDCNAKPAKAQKKGSKGKKKNNKKDKGGKQVAYQCQDNRRLTVSYRFNEQGIPTHASAQLNGKTRTLPYDLASSTNVETFFIGQGYRIGTDYMDADNYRSLPIMVTDPNDDILYKNCTPN